MNKDSDWKFFAHISNIVFFWTNEVFERNYSGLFTLNSHVQQICKKWENIGNL